MRTTSRTPDMGRPFTIPVNTTRRQMTILTLVTHDLGYSCIVPIVEYCSVIKHSSTNYAHHTRNYRPQAVPYYLVHTCSTSVTGSTHHSGDPISHLSPIPPILQHSPSNHHHLPASPLLLLSLIHDGASTRHISTTRKHNSSSLYPRPTKRCRTHPS